MGFQVLNMRGRDYHVLSIAKELQNGRAREFAREFGLENLGSTGNRQKRPARSQEHHP